MYIYIYIYTYIHGVNTNGAAAKVRNFDRLGKSYALALLGIQKQVNGSNYPKKTSVKNLTFAVTSLMLTPFVPFRALDGLDI